MSLIYLEVVTALPVLYRAYRQSTMDPKQTSGDLNDGCQMNTFFNYLFQFEDKLKKHGKKRESFKMCSNCMQ